MSTATMHDLDLAMASSNDDRKRVEQSYLRYAGTGIEFCVAIALPVLLGVWLDARFGTAPLLTIALAFVGFAAATWNLVRSVFPANPSGRKQDEKP